MVAMSGALPPFTALDSLVTPSGPAGTSEKLTLTPVCVLLKASTVSLAPAVADQKVRVTGLPSAAPAESEPPPHAVASRASEAVDAAKAMRDVRVLRGMGRLLETSNCGR
ncbi:hypothetical protein GA0115252_150020 [Streptomyces sp. DfronAA-171]|nr:hypothetical protein GA0115252_150020 [Streptomyces sp. DfronAA-171]